MAPLPSKHPDITAALSNAAVVLSTCGYSPPCARCAYGAVFVGTATVLFALARGVTRVTGYVEMGRNKLERSGLSEVSSLNR